MSLSALWKAENDCARDAVQTKLFAYLQTVWSREQITQAVRTAASKNEKLIVCSIQIEDSWKPFFCFEAIQAYLTSIRCDLTLVDVWTGGFVLSCFTRSQISVAIVQHILKNCECSACSPSNDLGCPGCSDSSGCKPTSDSSGCKPASDCSDRKPTSDCSDRKPASVCSDRKPASVCSGWKQESKMTPEEKSIKPDDLDEKIWKLKTKLQEVITKHQQEEESDDDSESDE